MDNLPKIGSAEVASTSPNAMVNDQGDLFYPDSPSEADWFATEHQAYPVNQATFPFPGQQR